MAAPRAWLGDALQASHACRMAGARSWAAEGLPRPVLAQEPSAQGRVGPPRAACPAARPGPWPPPGAAAPAQCPVSPLHPQQRGMRELDWRWRWSSCWAEPSESAILAVLLGRCRAPVARLCVLRCPSRPSVRRRCAVGAAVRCQGLGGAGRGCGPVGYRPWAIHRQWGGRRASHAANSRPGPPEVVGVRRGRAH